MDLHIYSPPNIKKTARLPRKSDAQRQRERKWILCAIGFNVTACRDIILQTWLCKEAYIGCQVVL